jgi:iron complex outermembrane receptor protein
MMKLPRFSRMFQTFTGMSLAIAASSAGLGQPAPQPSPPAASPSAGGEVIRLPEFNVTGALVDPYNAAEASSASRTASKILDTPLTAYVITPAMIQDVNPNALFDLTQYFAGVSPGRATGASGFNDRMTFRGMESFSRTMDNFSQTMIPYMYAPFNNFDPVFMDHAELIMGPDSILSPTGTPGGTVNVISKSPQFVRGTDVSAEVGNYNANKITVDSTGPIGDGKHMAYRVLASYQDSRNYAPGTYTAWAGAAEFTYKFSDTAKVMVKYFGSQQHLGGTVGESSQDGEEIYTPDTVGGATLSDTPQPGFQYHGWNGDATWSTLITRDNTAEAELTAALSDRINMRLAGEVEYTGENSLRGWPAPVLTEAWNPTTGQQTSVTAINPTALPEIAVYQIIMSRQIQAQNDFAGNFEAGGVSLKPVVGWAYQQGSMPVFYKIQDKAMPACNLAVGYYSPPLPALSAFNSLASNTPEDGRTMQAYGCLRAGFLKDRLFVTVGAARTWACVDDYSVPYVNPGGFIVGTAGGAVTRSTFSHTNNALAPSVKPWHDAYIAGALYKVLPNVSVYYNYSTDDALASAIPLWQSGVQNEFGAKANFFDNRITVSGDHFEIVQTNVSFQNPAFNTGQSTIQTFYQNLTSHGFEFNAVGGITRDLSVIASYTNQKLRDFVGRHQRNVPDDMANLLLDYHFHTGALKNADVFAGLVHQGAVAGETITNFTASGVPEQPGFYVKAYTVLNAGGGYQWGRYKFNLNVNNALNQRFWWQANSRTSLAPYPGTTVTLTINVHI